MTLNEVSICSEAQAIVFRHPLLSSSDELGSKILRLFVTKEEEYRLPILPLYLSKGR